ncbi:Unknown protein sequence [Pseudomonas coronafaciens pv. oryzae]|nr:Unknown protein sequence [Pseudomonas coronafaciens pv. oryzae]
MLSLSVTRATENGSRFLKLFFKVQLSFLAHVKALFYREGI